MRIRRCSGLSRQPPADKLVSEPFQKLRMRGPLAADAEVADRAHQALPEVMLPDPIDHHARQEGPGPLIHVSDPVRKRPSLASAVIRRDCPPCSVPEILGRF